MFITVLDILATAFIFYTALALLRRTRSIFILRGFIALIIFYIVALFLKLKLTILLFQGFLSFFVIILVIIFQREMRRFFENFSLSLIFSPLQGIETVSKDIVEELTGVVNYLAKKKIGALVVLSGKQNLERSLEGGTVLDGKVSKPLLLSIFDPSSPGHDGAVIIEGNIIKKFSAHLPLADNFKRFGDLGTRHRAGLGLAERSDAFVIIVSEERGTISIGHNNNLFVVPNEEKLKEEINKFIGEMEPEVKENRIVQFLKYNWKDKLIVFSLSTFLWYILISSLPK